MTAITEHNLNHLLVGRHLAGAANRPAVIDDTGTWTFAQLDHAAGAAATLMAECGVRSGDRVAVVCEDSRGWCAAFLGATRLGAIAAPLEPGGRHLEVTLTDLEPRLVVAADDAELPGAWPRLALDPNALADVAPSAPLAVRPTTPAYMIFSSGSTGRPKGVVHAHKDLATSIDGYATEVLELTEHDRCHSVAKLFASLGFGNGFFRPLGRGATIVLSRGRPNVRRVTHLVAEHGITVLTAVPTFWSQLATFLERHPDEVLQGVRLAVSSGDSLPGAVLAKVSERANLDLIEGLGCSECSNIVLSTRPGAPMPGRLGTVVGGVRVELRDDEGRVVPDGTPGRLWIKSPSNTTGYWRRPEETADVVHGEWVRMGDILRCDGGIYRHLGRVDDIFKVDARWVSPVEVEGVLHEHPAVQSAAVIGVTDGEGLTRVAAAILTDGRPTDGLGAELRRHVAHRLASYMAPTTIAFVQELPRGATGKLDRRALRELLTAG